MKTAEQRRAELNALAQREAQPRVTTGPRRRHIGRWIFGLLAAAFVLNQVWQYATYESSRPKQAASRPHRGNAAHRAVAAAPKPDYHEQRVEYHDYWNKSVGELAMVKVCIIYAARALAEGDEPGASQLLAQGQKFADLAKNDTNGGVPERFKNSDIGDNLFNASFALSDGVAKARAYLDDHRPSDMADARDDTQKAVEEIDSATHAARVVYIDMGGRGDDLESLADLTVSMVQSLDSLTGNK